MSKYGAMGRTGFGEDKGGEKSAVEQGLGVVTKVAAAKLAGNALRTIGRGMPSI